MGPVPAVTEMPPTPIASGITGSLAPMMGAVTALDVAGWCQRNIMSSDATKMKCRCCKYGRFVVT